MSNVLRRVALFVLVFVSGLVGVAKATQTEKAELFGIEINDLAKKQFEDHLEKMGVKTYPSYTKGLINYSLGKDGILGIKNLAVSFNSSSYFERATLSGVVENAKQRASLGRLLVEKYGEPTRGFVREGYGRAVWFFTDGTMIQLSNTTFDVAVVYVDQQPKQTSASGRIDVEALLRKSH